MAKKYLKDFYLKDYLTITFGLAIYAFGLVGFVAPGNLAIGGGTGIALLVEYAAKIPMEYTGLAINAVLLTIAVATKALDNKFLIKTVFGVLVLNLFIFLAKLIIKEGFIIDEPTFSGVIGGMLCGTGVGLALSANGSTGGMDIVIAIINKYRNISFGRAMLFIDFFIISCSYLIFHDYKIIVASLIVLGVMTYTIDMVINGSRQSVQVLIFSKKHEKIADAINSEMGRGCTVLDGTGWYSKTSTKVIIVLTKRSEADDLFRLIKTIDEDAFISQSNVRGVYGNGFDSIR